MPWPKGKSFSIDHILKRVSSFVNKGGKRKKSRYVDGIEMWLCPTCQNWLSAESFNKDKRTPNGLKSQCKSCHSKSAIRTRNKENKRKAGRFYERQRTSRKKNLYVPYTMDDLNKLIEILGSSCLICGSYDQVQWDHIMPVSKGGIDHPVNMQPLCR